MPDFSTDLTTLRDYILGDRDTGMVSDKMTRLPNAMFEEFMNMLAADSVAAAWVNTYEVHKDFYATMPDYAKLFPKQFQEELFYAAKLGHYYRQIPAFCEYIVRKSWEKCYGIPNLLFKVIPTPAMNRFFQKGYLLGGINMRDVVCNTVCADYDPISLHHPFNKVGDFTEVYVPKTDMVAALPNDIAEILTPESVTDLHVTPNGLALGNKLLRTSGAYVGAVNSIYDLREVI